MLNSKNYFRLLTLYDLGLELDPKIIELKEFIEYSLTNLNQYTLPEHPNKIFYGKSKNHIIYLYEYNDAYGEIFFNYNTFTKKLSDDFNTDYEFIGDVICYPHKYYSKNYFPENVCAFNWSHNNNLDLSNNNIQYPKTKRNI